MRLEAARSAKRRTISLTPLIDVVFILLLFFMITTTFQRQQAMTVNVPGPAQASTPSTLESLILTLAANGTLTLDGQSDIPQEALTEHPLMVDALATDMPIRIKPDDEVDLQTLTRLMDHLSTLGLSSVSLSGLH